MLYLISGAVASGKTTVRDGLQGRIPGLNVHDDAERPAGTSDKRMENLELWVQDAVELEKEGTDLLLVSQAPLGELLVAPSAIEVEGIAGCLLDCHDYVRIDRWRERGVHPDWPVHMDHFCWSAYHRMHARDSTFEQRVCTDRTDAASWSRWTEWEAGDPRWDVNVIDTSELTKAEVVDAAAVWVERIRRDGAPLRRSDEWWL